MFKLGSSSQSGGGVVGRLLALDCAGDGVLDCDDGCVQLSSLLSDLVELPELSEAKGLVG